MNWRPNVLACVLLMAALLVTGMLQEYLIVDVLLGASLLSNVAQSIVALDEVNAPRPVPIISLALMTLVFLLGMALGYEAQQVALAASLLGNVAQAIIKLEQNKEPYG